MSEPKSNKNDNYPFHYKRWGETAQGSPIDCFSSFSLEDKKKGPKDLIFIVGGVHGDEPEGVTLAKSTLEWLSSQEPQAVKPWILIPCINPDGFAANRRTNANAVDLNRNYPSKSWSAEFSDPQYNPGSGPSSENETKVMVHLIETFQPELIIHCHSYDPCVVYTGDPGKPYADILAEASGYPSQETIGYDCPGSLGDYGYCEHDTPVICIEAQNGAPLETVWPRFEKGIKEIFKSPQA